MKGALHGSKESGRIENEGVVDHPALHGCHESKTTAGLFKHDTRDISFTLVVDNFGIEWTNEADLDHLITSLENKHDMKVS